jgi:BirA family biotin operon repressor/biotin-[acetyl-CoA-carboxylase] ligase
MQRIAGWPLERQAECDSSNSELLRRASSLPDRFALVVDSQTAGRGRQGRIWHSPPGANLYLSLFARLPLPAAQLGGLSLVIGIGVAETLRDLGAVEVGLKWPNDLLARGRKLGGILIEIASSRGGHCEVVIGIGTNLRLPDGLDVGQPAIDLASLDIKVSRDALLTRLLPALAEALDAFTAAGFATFVTRWNALDLLRGQTVSLARGEQRCAEVLGVGADGSLRLLGGSGEFSWHDAAGLLWSGPGSVAEDPPG